jgi:hypothetical protein
MKYPKRFQLGDAIHNLIQYILLIIAVVNHDWFLLAVVFVLNLNRYLVINYNGHEKK